MKKYIVLCHGRTADQDFLNLIKEVVCEVIPAMQPNIEYKLKNICGKTFWGSLDHGERRTAGHCMVHLVKTGDLPLRIVESRSQYPVRYQLK